MSRPWPLSSITLRAAATPLAAMAFALLAGLVIFAASVARFATPATGDLMPGMDGVVVLTGGEHRVREGYRLFEQTGARRLLISGVNRQTTRDDLKRRANIPPALFACCVDVGYRALDTMGNAAETAMWADAWGFRRIAVVTSSYHMPRGLLELSRALPGLELVPHPVQSPTYGSGPWWTNANATRLLLVEYLKALPAMARYGVGWLSGRGHGVIAVAHQPATDMRVMSARPPAWTAAGR